MIADLYLPAPTDNINENSYIVTKSTPWISQTADVAGKFVSKLQQLQNNKNNDISSNNTASTTSISTGREVNSVDSNEKESVHEK